MTTFRLDSRLQSDTHHLGYFKGLHLLLMNNSRVPWFILVPETEKTELFELSLELQETCMEAVRLLSSFVKGTLKADKLNIAAIGNVVSQLHIHVVGRFEGDFCWPNPVWGQPGATPWSEVDVQEMKAALLKAFPATYKDADHSA